MDDVKRLKEYRFIRVKDNKGADHYISVRRILELIDATYIENARTIVRLNEGSIIYTNESVAEIIEKAML